MLGALHHLLQPGKVLLPFAITGLVVLLPLSYAPARVNLLVGAALTVAGVLVGIGGFGVLPGLFVLGFALAQAGFTEALDRLSTPLWITLAACAVPAAVAYLVAGSGAGELVGRRIGLVFSMSMAGGYAALFLLLLRTSAGPALSAALAPVGRLALTNYLTATLLFVSAGTALGLRGSTDWPAAALLGAAILLVQALWSAAWLHWFAYGPLEWAWRTVTYWRRIPIRRNADAG